MWNDVLPDDLQKDLSTDPPPVPVKEQTENKNVAHSLVFWLVYFLLVWQISVHISDNGMAWLLRFLQGWLKLLGLEISHTVLTEIMVAFPGTTYMFRQFLNVDRDNFNKFVVCPRCQKLYHLNECVKKVSGREIVQVCSGVRKYRGKNVSCGASLVYKVQLQDGKSVFYPIKYYCFNSIINSLETLIKRTGFADKCEQWRERDMKENEMADIYDGTLWKEFMRVDGKDFLNAFRNYAFQLNFDYFQPMVRRKDYSVGVFYLVILNLPRAERYKWENVIVIGIVPSLNKEPKNLNPFLQPAVDELQRLWKGIQLNSAKCRFPLTFRAAVISVSADVPAMRKLGGFKSHAALHGCSRCLKSFPSTFGNKPDFSGFDKENWLPRTNQQHRRVSAKIERIKKRGEKEAFGREHGITHYSVLLDLPYFDAIRFFTIDPMHNLFLGTAKKMFHIWTNKNVLTKNNLEEIEERIGLMNVPNTIGRLPSKITSNSGTYTAEQWKNWTLIYSVFCLKGILPEEDFKCWQTFVLACKHVCQPVISKTDIEISEKLFLKFCKRVEVLYGNETITPNMHLHCHLKEVLIDHGSASSFWCFSFERFNGILGSMTTNKRSLELQLMRKFHVSRIFDIQQPPDLFKQDLIPLCAQSIKDEGSAWLETASWLAKKHPVF